MLNQPTSAPQPAPQLAAQPVKGLPYEPTSDMLIAAREHDPALPIETIRAIWWAMWRTAPQPAAQHADDVAVDALAALMKAKLAKQRAKGYSGWDTDCTQQRLSYLLRAHVEKGDPVDVANFCAFLSARGEGIATQPAAQQREQLVRYCPGCGSIGPVEAKYRDCCPDGNEARQIPLALAEKCRATFKMAIELMIEAEKAAPEASAAAGGKAH